MYALLLFGLLFLNFGLYAVWQVLGAFVHKPQDLKKRYGARWAVVTGGSSGIGKSLAWRLASQGLNVVIVSLPGSNLDAAVEELASAFPAVQIRKIGTDLSEDGYLETVQKGTDDIDVQILFCNAGYLVTGLFHTMPLKTQLDNLDCNVTSGVALTHHFVSKMIAKNLKGCVVFTSSPAGFIPGPMSCLYASTKAFVSMFAASLAAEVKSHGVDVMAFHPSPILSRFYENQKKINILDTFKSIAQSPDTIPDLVFSSIGRTVWADYGSTAICFRLLTKLLDGHSFAALITATAHMMPDYKRNAS